MRVLALDTSTAACSAAIRDSDMPAGHLVVRRFEKMDRGQSEALAPMVQAVLRDAGLAVGDMDFVAVTTGPGAFTGVRIGLAMARALGVSAGLPVLGISTLLAVAHGVPQAERSDAWMVIVMDTKRDDVYVQVFDPTLSPVGEPEIIVPEAVSAVLNRIPGGAAILIAGDAVDRVSAHIAGMDRPIRMLPGIILPDAAVVAEIGMAMGPPTPDMPPPAPIYLRPPYAKVSPTGGKLRP